MPTWCSASAAVKPPIPAPMMITSMGPPFMARPAGAVTRRLHQAESARDHAGGFHERRPFLRFGGEEGGEFGRRAELHLVALTVEGRLQLGRNEAGVDRGVECVDDRGGSAGRCQNSNPVTRVECERGHCAFGCG